MIGLWLGEDFLNVDLLIIEVDYSLQYNCKWKFCLYQWEALKVVLFLKVYNKFKQYFIEVFGNVYLQAMGIIIVEGKVWVDGQCKFC